MQVTYKIKKSFRRSISMTISDDGTVLVKAPHFVSEKEVQDFIVSKKSWVTKHIEKTLATNEKVNELGILTKDEIKKIKKEAKKIIPERVKYYASLSGITYGTISIRLQKTCWGSCTAKGNLNFNCLIVLMPREVLDSIVVHELCHRRHMDHSKEFYAEIDKIFPEYKKWNKWLKENGDVYLKRAGGKNIK